MFSTPSLTGTSIAAAATSATAALVWSYMPEVSAIRVMDWIYAGGTKLQGNPDYCRGANCMQGEIRKVFLCGALDAAGLVVSPGSCPGAPLGNPMRYEIAVKIARVDELREFMRFACVHFEQETLYFKVSNTVEFLDNPLGWP